MTALLFAALAVLFSQVVKGVTGFGSALVAVPALALVWGPREAVLVITLVDVAAGLVLAVPVRHLVRPGLMAALLLPMIGGQWVGTEALVSLPEPVVRVVFGVLVGLFALEMLWMPVRQGRGELSDLPAERGRVLASGAGAGLVGGMMGGLIGAPGPALVVFARYWFEPVFFRAQLILVLAVSSVTLVGMLAFKGVGDGQSLVRAGLLLAPQVVGNLVGARVAGKLDRAAFGRIVGAVLLLAAGTLVYGGLAGC